MGDEYAGHRNSRYSTKEKHRCSVRETKDQIGQKWAYIQLSLYPPSWSPEGDTERRKKHDQEVSQFIALLMATAADPQSRVTVVLTVRADFYTPLIRHPLINELLPKQQINIPVMLAKDIRAAIVTPAKEVGLSFRPPKLVDEIVNDIGVEEGRLPLLQFALKEIWQRRNDNMLTGDAYTEIGSVTGAIEKTAQALYDVLSPEQKDAARRLFLGLVTPGEGQPDTRARSLYPTDLLQQSVVAVFSDPKTRLIVTSFTAPQNQTAADLRATVEVAHEALIQNWETLKSWVNQNREKLRDRATVLRAMAEWELKRRPNDYLLPAGAQLERGRDLIARPGDVQVDDIRKYVERSIEVARLAAQASERKLRRYLMAVTGAAGLALIGLAFSYYEYKIAVHQTVVAEKETKDKEQQVIQKQEALELANAQRNRATEMAKETQRELDRANQAIAEALSSELDFGEEGKVLSPRVRNALWKLTLADKNVKRSYILLLLNNSEEMLRAAQAYPR